MGVGLHALVDVEWDFFAVTAPPMFALGVLLAGPRPLWVERSPGLDLGEPFQRIREAIEETQLRKR